MVMQMCRDVIQGLRDSALGGSALRSAALRGAVLAVAVTALSACGSILPDSPELTVYQLPQHPLEVQQGASSAGVLRVTLPYTRDYLDTNRLVVRTPQQSLAVQQGIRWDDSNAVVWRDSLIRSLRGTGAFDSVMNEEGGAADHVLRSELHDFLVDFSVQPPAVVIRLDVQLQSLGEGSERRSEHRVEVQQPVPSPSNEAIVEAFGQANHQVQQQLYQWLIRQ